MKGATWNVKGSSPKEYLDRVLYEKEIKQQQLCNQERSFGVKWKKVFNL